MERGAWSVGGTSLLWLVHSMGHLTCVLTAQVLNVISISSSASGLFLEAPILGNGVPAGEGRRAS